ncbi:MULTISPECIES: cytochrome b N-terminal domain-containing protein [Cyanophyceae]|uniref:cytochrome b N-terminal domain-containing protein n=1 Tax=Cyanophyceae TaxID=3028117 RepID=UPI0016857788|nr:cytochrome b N-terminal domain-containing protein [Trichocoleus sp. FACHB-40]MBD2003824.1 cytochrome bc complex cytochrome b subunit [Trichocoleus sp. FACHB-40]
MNTEKYEFIFRRLATILAVSILTLSLSAAFTGILLAFYYEPSAGGAYESLKNIATEVPNGSLIRDVHDIAGNGVIVVSLIEIVVMFLGRKFTKSWLTGWISVIFFTLNAIALAWTAMILDWSQLGYWRLSIELQTIEAIPFIGSQLRDILTGGGGITTATVEHLYTIHSYILSVSAIALAITHLGALLVQERQQTRLQMELKAISSTSEPDITQAEIDSNSLTFTNKN